MLWRKQDIFNKWWWASLISRCRGMKLVPIPYPLQKANRNISQFVIQAEWLKITKKKNPQ